MTFEQRNPQIRPQEILRDPTTFKNINQNYKLFLRGLKILRNTRNFDYDFDELDDNGERFTDFEKQRIMENCRDYEPKIVKFFESMSKYLSENHYELKVEFSDYSKSSESKDLDLAFRLFDRNFSVVFKESRNGLRPFYSIDFYNYSKRKHFTFSCMNHIDKYTPTCDIFYTIKNLNRTSDGTDSFRWIDSQNNIRTEGFSEIPTIGLTRKNFGLKYYRLLTNLVDTHFGVILEELQPKRENI